MVGLVAWLGALSMAQAASPPAPAAPPKPPPPPAVDELIVVAPKRQEPERAPKLNFDVRGVHERSKTPYWQRPLEKGCRVTAAGLACVRKF